MWIRVTFWILLLANFPMLASEYLGNNQRSGYTDATVPRKPVLRWTYRERHAPRNAWPEPLGELQFIDFDYADQVTIGDKLAYFGSSADHTVRALDIATGKEQWAFHAEGPVRFAPVLHEGQVYTVSDDGFLYCLKATDGSLAWKKRLAPGSERCIGNEQVVSKWPCRSGLLIQDGKLYTTAGMWSNDGVLIYCLDAAAGKVIWKNDATSYRWMLLPHGSGYGGVSPQGYLALYKDTLYVAAGRSAPAIFDAKSGKLLFHEIGLGYKAHYPGGSWIMASHDWVMFKRQHNYADTDVSMKEYELGRNQEGIIMYHYRTGTPEMALTGKRIVAAAIGDDLVMAGDSVIRVNVTQLRAKYKAHKQVKKQKGLPKYYDPTSIAKWNVETGRIYTLLIAGNTVIGGGRGTIVFIDAATGKKTWQTKVNGSVRGLSVQNNRLIASTTSGRIYCFGEGAVGSPTVVTHKPQPSATKTVYSKAINEIGVNEGYCLMLGVGDGSFLFELLAQTKLVVSCLEPDAAKRKAMQERLDQAGLLGVRAQMHSGDFGKISYAPYSSNCVVWGSMLGSSPDKVDLKGLYRTLRPWGGVALELGGRSSKPTLVSAGVPRNEICSSDSGTLIKRGPLPGAGEWTRGHANEGNTFSTTDEVVKLPLGILWWGGVGPERIVSRHWRAPVPLFSKGHMFIQGQHDIIGVDAYTGREMWNRHIEGIGRFPSTYRGGNIITDGDRVYCVKELTCYALDAKTGKTVQEYKYNLGSKYKAEMERFFPAYQVPKGKKKTIAIRKPMVVWEYLGMSGDFLIGTLGVGSKRLTGFGPTFPSMSRIIFAYDKKTGKKVWEIELEKTVSPHAIVSDSKCIYFIDRTDEPTFLQIRKKRMKDVSSSLKAISLKDGKLLWKSKLSPVRKALMLKDGIIVATAHFNENATDMNSGVSAFNAADGKMIWNIENPGKITKGRRGGPVRKLFIVGDTLYIPYAIDLKTGKEKLVNKDPITGKPGRFQLSGQNFCGQVAASKHVLAYRSTGLGFKSLTDDSPNYWLSEKRTSCWISLLPVGGLVLAPEGSSKGCSCSFNYKTSLALVPVERHESWGIYLKGSELGQGTGSKWKGGKPIKGRPADFKRLKVNLNAPGDHYDKESGDSFMAWPQATTAGKGFITTPVTSTGKATGFRFNSDFTTIAGTSRPWIYASGLTGERTVKILGTTDKKYRIVLHFMEPEDVRKGERVFDVLINGKKVLSRFDIAREAGGCKKAILREVKDVGPATTIEVTLKSVSGKPPILCAIEAIAQ